MVKIAASSAYREQQRVATLGRVGLRMLELAASETIQWRGSIAKINNIDERGSPCLSPLAWRKVRPGIPFRIILEDEDARSAVI